MRFACRRSNTGDEASRFSSRMSASDSQCHSSLMSARIAKIPSIPDLIAAAGDMGYKTAQPGNRYTSIDLELDANHPVVVFLVQYAVLVTAGLEISNQYLAGNEDTVPDLSVVKFRSICTSIKHLRKKPCRHYRGWIGEIMTHFILRHFITGQRPLLDYEWEEIQPPGAEVTDSGPDIVAVYALSNKELGHISGEVKTYDKLADAKSKAYSDLDKAHNWTHNRGAQIRRALNSLLRGRCGIGAIETAVLAMGSERSFLPSVLHNSTTKYKRKKTFQDMPGRFTVCERASQLIGIQIAISDYASSCDSSPLVDGFFETFLMKMRLQAICWKKPSRHLDSVR